MKIATEEDISEIKAMALRFLDVSGYKDFGDADTIDSLIRTIVTSDPRNSIIIFNSGVGFIAGTVTPFIFGTCKLATEVAWWVQPEARGNGDGLKLLQAFEYWAKNIANCKLISMSSLDKAVEKYYKKNGYKLYERAYMKVV